jgi:hypothetical protein
MAQLVTDSAPVAARGAECGLWSGEYWAQQVIRAEVATDTRGFFEGIRRVDLPPGSGGVRSERHAAASIAVPSMLALASAGVR